MEALKRKSDAPEMKLYDKADDAAKIWEYARQALARRRGYPASTSPGRAGRLTAVPPEKLGPYLRELCDVYDAHGYKGAFYGHFGQGAFSTPITFDFYTAEGIQQYRRFIDEATTLVTKYGGSLSGEHGDGQSKAEFLSKMFGTELVEAFREFKQVWDPEWKMNPGKVIDAYRIDENLRLGTDYNPPPADTHFHFREDGTALRMPHYAV